MYFTLNMGTSGLPLHMSHDIIWDEATASLSDVSAASTTSAPSTSTSAAALTASSTDASAPALPPVPCAPAAAAIHSDASNLSTLERSRSSPFVNTGLAWAAQLAKEEKHLAASISVASAVHQQPERSATRTEAVCTAKGTIRCCTQPVTEASTQTHVLTPRLSAQTSMMLKSNRNPLEEALSEDLANRDMPVLFLHGVGGVPAYLEMLLQVKTFQMLFPMQIQRSTCCHPLSWL